MPTPLPRPGAPAGAGERAALLALVLVAVAARVAYVLALRAHPAFEAPVMDAGFHWEWARALASGREFADGPFFRAPLYPLSLAGLVAAFGDSSTLPARLAQALLGGLSVALTWALGRRVGELAGGARSASFVGLGAAALVACSWSLIASEGELFLEALYLPLLLGATLAGLRAVELPTARRVLVAGAVLGLAAITRPNVLLCAPVPFVLLWSRAGLRTAALLVLGALAPILPVTLHNALEGDTALIATQGGVNLWIGNNPTSDGATAIVPGTRGGWWEGYEDAVAAANAAEGRVLRPSEVSAHYTGRVLDYVRSEPAHAAQLLVWKARLFLSASELGNNSDPRFVALRYAPWLGVSPVRFGWLVALGAVGLMWAARRGAAGRLVGGMALVHALSVVLFFVNSRFRLPVVPSLAIGAAFFAAGLHTSWRSGQRRGAIAALTAAVALGVLAYWPLPGMRDGRATGLMDLAKAELARGDARAAAALFEEALAYEPNEVFARVGLASAWQRTGEADRALDLLEETLALPEGRRPEVVAQLVDALSDVGRPADARRIAEEDLAREPRQPALRYGLARALGMLGDAAGARVALQRVLADDPSAGHAAFALAELEESVGDRAAARAAFERVVAMEGRIAPLMVAEARRRLAALP